MSVVTNEESLFEVFSNIFGEATGGAEIFPDGEAKLHTREFDEIIGTVTHGAAFSLVTSDMEILGMAALRDESDVPRPTFIIGHEERDFEFNVWLFKESVDFVLGSKIAVGLERAAKKLDEESHIGVKIPIPGVNGWDFVGEVGKRWDVADWLDAVGIDADTLGDVTEREQTPQVSDNVPVREDSVEVELPVREDSQDTYKDAVIHGDVGEEFANRKMSLGVSLKGAKTPPGAWKNFDLTVAELVDRLAEHEQGAKDGKCVLQGEVIDGERKAQAMKACYIVMLDLDTGEDLDGTIAKIKELGLFAMVWTTHSHLKPSTSIKKDAVIRFIKEKREPTLEDVKRYLLEVKRYQPYILEGAALGPAQHDKEGLKIVIEHKPMPKFRVLFVLEKPFVFADFLDNRTANEAWKAAYERTSDMLGAFYDKACTDPSRLMYTPRHGQDATGYCIHVIAGKALDFDNMKPPEPKNKLLAFAATDTTSSTERKGDEFKTPWLRAWLGKNSKAFLASAFFETYGEFRGARNGPGGHYKCPNDDEHTDAGNPDDKGFYAVDAGDSDYVEGFIAKCMHGGCAEKDRGFFCDLVIAENELSEADMEEFVDAGRVPEEVKTEYVANFEAQKAAVDDEDDEEDVYYTSAAVYVDPDVERAMKKMNSEWAIVTLGSDVRVMKEPKEIGKSPTFFGMDAFRNLLANKKINVPGAEEGQFKAVGVAKLWLEWPERRTYEAGVIFEPMKPVKGGYNLWRGYPLDQTKRQGSWAKMRAHLYENVCQGNDEHFYWVMTWMAQVVQQPGRKMGSSIAIRGPKGSGQSIVFDWFRKGMGIHAIKVSQKKHIVGDFNGHQKGVTLMVCEEAFWAGDHAAGNALKDLITSDQMMFEQKGIDAVPISNYVRLLFISNENWIVPAGLEDERRYMVIQCGDKQRGNIPYFLAIVDEMENGGLEAMWHELSNWDPRLEKCGGFKEGWNILRTPPITDQLIDQAMETIEAWDKFFIGFIEDGMLEASSHPDLPEIILERDETNYVSVANLRAHFEAYLERFGGNAKHKLGNRGFLKQQAIKYLFAEETPVSHRISGEVVRCYKCPTLPEIRRLAVEKRKIKLDLPDDAGEDD
mgnify:FL=1